ncbi:TerC family protein [Halothiobacillus sp.]|uniref:TerC family protein n=1 Tax=Halothiobacillus sp. TaxID=1891311 RepID=UPI002606F2E6|nr:TerC family protein [Halothiobacillus sp.]
MIELLLSPETWVAFATLTALEIVLGIDNIIVIAILVSKLPESQRAAGRFFGLALAMVTRIGLLFSLVWLMGLTKPFLHVGNLAFSGRDLILLVGGLFLVYKAVTEMHDTMETGGQVEVATTGSALKKVGLWTVVIQIALIDIVFSLDSVITAIGLVKHIEIMVVAIVAAVLVMMLAAKSISQFVERHPTIKMLALSFLILVGVFLIAESFGQHVPKGYIYSAMAFSLVVESLNIRMRKKREQLTSKAL